jgi:hypothetical protein
MHVEMKPADAVRFGGAGGKASEASEDAPEDAPTAPSAPSAPSAPIGLPEGDGVATRESIAALLSLIQPGC